MRNGKPQGFATPARKKISTLPSFHPHSVAKRELTSYLKKSKIKKGRLFPNLDRPALELLVKRSFRKIKVHGRYTPHSLRHTAGQLMYEKGIPLELIQKTLRHADMRTTMIYSQKAIDLGYFKRMKRF